MSLKQTALRRAPKTGELLIKEGLARKEDIEAALEIQHQELNASGRSAGSPQPDPPAAARFRRIDPPLSEEADIDPGFPGGEHPEPDEPIPSDAGRNPERTIGRILCDLHLVSPVDLNRILRKYKKQLKLGEILLRDGAVDRRQLEAALYEQQQRLLPLGHILVHLGHIDEDQLYAALSKQYNISYQRLEGFSFTPSQRESLIRMVGRNYVEENQIVPIRLEGTKLTLGVCVAEQMIRLQELATVYAYLRVECVLIRPDTFRNLFVDLFGSEPTIDFTFEPEDPPAGAAPADRPAAKKTQPDAEKSEGAEIVQYLIKYGIGSGASSIHIEQDANGTAIRYRIDGALHSLDEPWMKEKLPHRTDAVLSAVKQMAGLDGDERRVPQSGRFSLRYFIKEKGQHVDFDVRVSTCGAVAGENATLILSESHPEGITLENLQHPYDVAGPLKKLLDDGTGIVLVSGPAGSRKALTLHAAVSHLVGPQRKVITIAEAFEHSLPGIMQIRAGTEPNQHPAELLKSAVHHDPDVILLEKMGDRESLSTAYDVAMAGPMILGGFAASDAVDALCRLEELGLDRDRILHILKGVLAQRCLRKICSHCKETYLPQDTEWRHLFDHYPARHTFFRGKGCSACRYTGYSGELILSEILIIDDMIAHALRQGADAREMRRVMKETGCRTLKDDAIRKLNQTTLTEIFRKIPVFDDPPEAPDDIDPADLSPKTWSIRSAEADPSVTGEMYGTYARLKRRSGKVPVFSEADVFRTFIAAHCRAIRQTHGCDRVTFTIEIQDGLPVLYAIPGSPPGLTR